MYHIINNMPIAKISDRRAAASQIRLKWPNCRTIGNISSNLGVKHEYLLHNPIHSCQILRKALLSCGRVSAAVIFPLQ